jgi:hypothetical protein
MGTPTTLSIFTVSPPLPPSTIREVFVRPLKAEPHPWARYHHRAESLYGYTILAQLS